MESNTELDFELLYSQAFFMGLLAGVVLTKCYRETPTAVAKKAKKFVKQVPLVLKSAGDHSKINDLLGQLHAELGFQELSHSAVDGLSDLSVSQI